MSSDGAVEFTPAELLKASAFAHPVTRLELRETHISWIILTGPFAYKIKKSVRLEFLDASTLALRRHLCEEELRLNRRLAADLYVDVCPITREAGVMRVGGSGAAVEYAVRMKQFESSQELSALLDQGGVSPEEIIRLAQRLATFHQDAPEAANPDFPHTDQLHDTVLGNLAILLAHLDGAVLPELRALIDWTHDRLHDSLEALRMRERCGFVRECHGDLHAGNIVRWAGELVPFDCLEFDPKLRWIDVMSDCAFLVMDLWAHGRQDLAWWFLNSYLERTGDYAGVRLLRFYAVYRALVRAMVDSLGARHDRLRMRIKTAAVFMNRPPPALYIMHGLSGSGKSWLSERLAVRLGAVRMRSDVERRRLAGAPTSDRYTPQFGRRTYARLIECAEGCLQGSMSVIVDAAFLEAEQRHLFRDLASRHRARYVIIHCVANAKVLAQRIAQRRQMHTDPSEAGIEVLELQLQKVEPLDADDASHAVVVDTNLPDPLEVAYGAVDQRLASMRPR